MRAKAPLPDTAKGTYSRRHFLRMAAGAAIAAAAPACRLGEWTSSPTPALWTGRHSYQKSRPWRIGRSGRGDVNPWMVMFSAHIEYGITEKYRRHFSAYYSASANWDPNKQVEDIKALLARGIDALLIDPMDAQVVATGVQEAFEAGVAVIAVSSPLSAAPYVCFATLDAEGRGMACVDWIVQHASGGQVIVAQSVPAAGDSESWLNGVSQRLQGAPNILATTVECPWSVEAARESIASMIGDLTIDGVIVENGLLGRGVVEAFAQRSMAVPPIAGVDDWNGWLRTARESGVRFLAQSGGVNLGLHAVELAVEVLSGHQVPRFVELPYEVFDQSAVPRYHRPDLTDHYWAINELPQTWIERMFRP